MPVAMKMGGATYYLSYDQVGSPRLVADGSGNVVKRISYDSFGNILEDTNPSFTIPFGFAGGLHDRDTGLVRFGFRDYDPEVGRWTAKDPIGFAGGDTDLYGYVLNNPVNWSDPFGLDVTVTLYFGAFGYGHVGIGVNSTRTTGFYPTPGASEWDVITGKPVPGEMRPDNKERIQSITIPTLPEVDRAVQDFINNRTANPGRFDLNDRNCATTVRDALAAGGIPTPQTIYPRDLMQNLQQQFAGAGEP
jgi:RHS repeat-associated protein